MTHEPRIQLPLRCFLLPNPLHNHHRRPSLPIHDSPPFFCFFLPTFHLGTRTHFPHNVYCPAVSLNCCRICT